MIGTLKKEQNYNMEERILCAAIWLKEVDRAHHRPINTPGGVVVCGHRHGHCISQIVALTCLPYTSKILDL